MANQLAATQQPERMDRSLSLKRSLMMVLHHNLELHKELVRIRECNSRAAEVLFGSPDAGCSHEQRPGSPTTPSCNRVAFAPASPNRRFSEPLRHWAEDSGNTA